MVSKKIGVFLSLLLALSLCRFASAHPMGNFSVNHYSKISVDADRIRVRYYIDRAEIPTYQELQQANIGAAKIDPGSAEVVRYIAARGVELGHGLMLDVDGRSVPLQLLSSGVIFPPGAGGLRTMKMGFVYEAPYPSHPTIQGIAVRQRVSVHYTDNNYPGHTGWKEIIAVPSTGSLVRSSVPATDRSNELSNYPTDLLNSPPQDLEASVVADLSTSPVAAVDALPHSASERLSLQVGAQKRNPVPSLSRTHKEAGVMSTPAPTLPFTKQKAGVRPTGISSSTMDLQANRQETPRSRFTELIQAQDLSAWFLFTAALIAIGLGGLHALEPGHGKTIVAASLVGSKGTARHAVLLGMIVTGSHTVGVFALGAITLYASKYIVPEKLYPWLGALSGITIAGLGFYMLLRRLSGTAADHTHALGESHGHWRFWKRSADENLPDSARRTSLASAQSVSLTQLLTLGITGGIIPCPAALIVLLSAFALHRIGLGFFLIVAFSIGLAAVLISFGMLMVYARRIMARLHVDGPLTNRWLPAASCMFITILGLILTMQALSATHLDLHLLSREKMGPLLFVMGLGLILGMRHSTDADHVVAIFTIVSKQRSIRNAAFIGSVWGMGHTITIFVVGALIILCGVVIPPRVGLSMEFSVAVMLILLGLLNLTGVAHKFTAHFTPVITRTNAPIPKERDAPTTRIRRSLEDSIGRFGLYQCLRPLVIGLVHGLAGSAAVALLVLSTIHDPVWATVYLLIFGAGTMMGMMLMTAAIAVTLKYAGDRFSKLSTYLGVASGIVSLCFGSLLVYQLGFLGGLFTNHPEWTPR